MRSTSVSRLLQKDDRLSWVQHVQLVRRLQQWCRDVEAFPILQRTKGDVTAYVANFRRPHNIQLIVRSLLACPSIGRIIVSNNNPECDLAKFFTPSSDRVVMLEHDKSQNCIMRHDHLERFPSPYYLIVDDDLFLLPSQIECLLEELKNDPSVPHGLYGQRWEDEHFHGGIEQVDDVIDVISRVYAFTAAHHEQFMYLSSVGTAWSDDIVLSFSGKGKPRIHNVGALVDCPSQGARDIATWRLNGFHADRMNIYRTLADITTMRA